VKTYVLRDATAALHDESERTIITILPPGSRLRLLSAEPSDGFTQIEWQDQKLLIFARDLEERSEPLELDS
jgi:hypothetical protein